MPFPRPLRSHQRQFANLIAAIAQGEASVRDILAAVTPGGGKSLLPVIAAARLIASGVVRRIVWVVPRDSLRLQAEEAFTDPAWRLALGHALTVRAAENAPDPCRGLAGYVTTYQAVAAAPTCTWRRSGDSRPCWSSTRCTICPRWRSSTRAFPHPPPRLPNAPRRRTRPPGRPRCCRCWNAPGCA